MPGLLSMTGYGTSVRSDGTTTVAAEIRTVNHRSLDIHARLPRDMVALEVPIQQQVREKLARGRIDVSVSVETVRPPRFTVSADAARAYLEAAASLREMFGLEDKLGLRTLMTLPGVIETRESNGVSTGVDGATTELVLATVRQALDGVLSMRNQEGSVLALEMKGGLSALVSAAGLIRSLVPRAVEAHRERLTQRLAQLLPLSDIDPQRVAQEMAVLAERSDISEEVARLESHSAQYAAMLERGGELGKKLDFLLQEMQREANTILSKSCSLEITRAGLAIRAGVEKMRELVQNVE